MKEMSTFKNSFENQQSKLLSDWCDITGILAVILSKNAANLLLP